MKNTELVYLPPPPLVERARFFLLRTLWHDDLTATMEREARTQLSLYRFPETKVHTYLVAGAFELPHLAAAVARLYAWKRGFAQVVSVRGPTHIQSNLRLPPFFQGNFESQLRSEFLLESPGPIGYLQPYEPDASQELPVIITMGCILKGETDHNRYLAYAIIHELSRLNSMTGVPIVLGVLTPDTIEQAWERVSYARDWVKAGFLSWESRLSLPQLQNKAPTDSSTK